MKKIFVAMLVLLTILSTVSFAVPTMVSTVTTAQEETQTQAILEEAAELEEETINWA